MIAVRLSCCLFHLQLAPQVNSVWSNDDVNLLTTDEVCVAVATDNGLITPIVRNAAGLQVEQISAQVKVSTFVFCCSYLILHRKTKF